jgi:hypothetical protein
VQQPFLTRMLRAVVLPPAILLAACVGGSGPNGAGGISPPVANTLTLTVDGGPAAAPGAINHAYATVRVCAPGSSTQCANIDHVLLDTASWGLRIVGSVLAAQGVTLATESDGSAQVIEECVNFGGGSTWGPIALADVMLAGESATGLPVQIMDDTDAGAPPPATCTANGPPSNAVGGFYANGILGVGVFAQDCGTACAPPAAAQPVYFGCSAGAAGICTAEDVPLAQQVTNPVAKFASDNNGVIVSLPNLINANGDLNVSGTLLFGIGTQADNMLPVGGLTVLGTNASGDFSASYTNGATVLTGLSSWIDSGSDGYEFNDPGIAACTDANWVGYYCPAVSPLALSATNTGLGAETASSTVAFAVAAPANGVQSVFILPPEAAAYAGLAGVGDATRFVWGMPYFYGRRIYVGIEQRSAGSYTGPYFAY